MRMSKYWGHLWIRIRASVQYRFAFISGIIAALLQIAIQYAIWMQVFQGRASINGFEKADMLTYLLLSQGVLMIFAFRNAPERLISQKIREGDIALELIRPVQFTMARFFENLGDSMLNICLAFVLLCAARCLFRDLSCRTVWFLCCYFS